jgi:hypothetical protein
MSDRDQIVTAFESHREAPGMPYSEEHFLDYLLERPSKKGYVRNSFSGLRRFNAFIDQVQLELSICFSLKDREANYSLDRFVARVAELRASPRSSLASFRNQARAGFGGPVFLVANGLFALVYLALGRSNEVLSAVCIVVLIMFNLLAIWLFIRYRRYMARLYTKLSQAAAMKSKKPLKATPPEG